jgi:uncharacterized protein (DUF433 family)
MGAWARIPDSGRWKPIPSAHPTRFAEAAFALVRDLIEAHMLRSLRTEHGVSVKALRTALAYAESALGIDRLLLRSELRTDSGRIFLDRYGELIELSASGQLAMRRLLEEHLKRVEWDASNFPVRLYPFVFDGSTKERSIVIDPRIAFGRPVVLRSGVSTFVIAERIDAGETVRDIAADYDLDSSEIEQAALYERAARVLSTSLTATSVSAFPRFSNRTV